MFSPTITMINNAANEYDKIHITKEGRCYTKC